jgi:dTDP-4-amino-4,6-dideoxygalactose transaminase
MANARINFCSPVIPNFNLVESYLKDSIALKHLSNFGPATNLLSERLSQYLSLNETKDIVILSSGHTALMAAYSILNIKKPLIPAYTFYSTYCSATILGI